MTPEILTKALNFIYLRTKSPPVKLLVRTTVWLALLPEPETVYYSLSKSYRYCGIMMVVDESLPYRSYKIICDDHSTWLFEQAGETVEPVKCMCGLAATLHGGIHLDYCHPSLVGTYMPCRI